MWISKKKWDEINKKVADLEKIVRNQQIHVEISRKAFSNSGLNYDLLAAQASRKQS